MIYPFFIRTGQINGAITQLKLSDMRHFEGSATFKMNSEEKVIRIKNALKKIQRGGGEGSRSSCDEHQ